MGKASRVTTETTEFEFDITEADLALARKSSRLYNEDDGVVAIAFKRQFPDEPFVCAHGDYYIGLGTDLDNTDRYIFDTESTIKIGEIFAGLDVVPVTVRAYGVREL